MAELKQFIYPYGTFYDPNIEDHPSPKNHDIVVYVHTQGENREIGSLEGLFVCNKQITLPPRHNIPCRRAEMKMFEEKYDGRFISFER